MTAITIRNKLLQAASFLLFAFVFSLMSFFFPEISPKNDPPEIWFQRSGSFMVVASIWAEFILIRLQGYLDSYNEAYIVITDVPAYLATIQLYISKSTLIFAILGTFIWGYGDLLI